MDTTYAAIPGIREIMGKIFNRAMEINSTPTCREETGDKPTIFVHFSGHVCTVEVQIIYGGWETGLESDGRVNYTIYLAEEFYKLFHSDTEFEKFDYTDGKKQMETAMAVLDALNDIYAKYCEKDEVA